MVDLGDSANLISSILASRILLLEPVEGLFGLSLTASYLLIVGFPNVSFLALTAVATYLEDVWLTERHS